MKASDIPRAFVKGVSYCLSLPIRAIGFSFTYVGNRMK